MGNKEMKKIEELFNAQKTQLAKIEVPDELEACLRSALTGETRKSGKRQPFYRRYITQVKVAAVLIFALLVGFNYDVIASYGKQLFGYDQVMDVTLRDLNDLGKGQLIEKSHTFANGVSLSVDYVMLDENQLLLFYTVKDPAGDVTNAIQPFMTIKSFFGESRMQSSQGLLNEEGTEAKYIASFESPPPLARKLTLIFSPSGHGVITPTEISFDLDRGTAMGHTLKKGLMQSVKVDETKIKFESILASPTQTVIKGSAQSIFGLALDTISGERFRPREVNLRLIANGQEVEKKGGGISTDMKGITFHTNFDALPTPLTELKLELVSFSADHDVNKQYDLDKNSEKQILDILGQKVEINEVKDNGKETLITISSAENLVLTKVYLIADGKQISLEETIDDQYEKTSDGLITHQRTLRFLGTGDDLRLDVKRMSYTKDYHEVVDIPLD